MNIAIGQLQRGTTTGTQETWINKTMQNDFGKPLRRAFIMVLVKGH